MKADLVDLPLVGNIVRAFDPILIDRKSSVGRKKALDQIAARPVNINFPKLLIFPEGTTSRGDNLTQFKRGAFTSGLPVQPVVLKYPHRHFDVSLFSFFY